MLHEIFARVVSENVREGVVALEDAAVDRVAINAGEIAAKEHAMPLFAAAQCALGARAFDCADENLAGDAQQRDVVIAPIHDVAHRIDSDESGERVTDDERHGEH